MRMEKIVVLSFLSVVMVAGCATPPGGYSRFSTESLCIDYLTLPAYNINQRERAVELARRSESCDAHIASARQIQERRRLQDEANLIASQKASQKIFDDSNSRMFETISNQPKSINCTSMDLGGIISTQCR